MVLLRLAAVFRKPEDVKKLFVVDDEKYVQLEPFISIKPIADKPKKEWDKLKYEQRPKWEKSEYVPKHIELNNNISISRTRKINLM